MAKHLRELYFFYFSLTFFTSLQLKTWMQKKSRHQNRQVKGVKMYC